MLNERKLTERELDKRAEAIRGLLSNKRTLVKKYGKDAEKVMYGIATKQAKNKIEDMNLDKLKELIQDSLRETNKDENETNDALSIDTSSSGGANYGEEDKALGSEDELEMKGFEESLDESNSNYPDFDLDKNIKYQDTSISSGMWRYTGKEQGGKGVYRNLNNGQILGFSKDDFDIFRKHLSSHFDISESLDEAKKKKAKKKDNRPIGKPMRDTSGGKAYKVYVKDPKTKKVKTVRFGSGGLRAKINDSKARAAFAARHKCSQKKDRTKAGYWSCRLPRYAKLLGLKSSFSGFW